MNRYFIEATVPFNYNQSGVYYPYNQPVDFKTVLKKYGITHHSWSRGPFQDKVLCFNFEGELTSNAFENDLPYGLKISKRTWR